MADLTLNEINDGYKGGSLTDEEIVRAMLAQFAREYHRIFPLEGENETWDILLKKKTENTLTMLKKNQAYKESLSFTNEKLVEIIAEATCNHDFEFGECSMSWEEAVKSEDKGCYEYYIKAGRVTLEALSPYLSTIEQAKKEERIAIGKYIKENIDKDFSWVTIIGMLLSGQALQEK